MSTAIGTVYRCNRIAHATDLSSKQGSAMTLEKLSRWWDPEGRVLTAQTATFKSLGK